jgi:hypothetical protein
MVTKCFVEYKDASSQIKLRGVWRRFVFNEKCFDVNKKKGRCFSPSAQKNCKCWFRPQQSNSYIDEEVRLYYKVWINMYNILLKCRLQSFAKQKSQFFYK